MVSDGRMVSLNKHPRAWLARAVTLRGLHALRTARRRRQYEQRAAAERGFTKLDAVYLAENDAAAASLAKAGFVAGPIEGGLVTASRKLATTLTGS